MSLIKTDLSDVAEALTDYHGVNVTEDMLLELSENMQDLFAYGYVNMLTYDEWQESLYDAGMELSELVAEDFKSTFNWDAIKEKFNSADIVDGWEDFDTPVRILWLGTVFACTPSGKVYAPFANSNVTWFAAMCDESWQEILDDMEVGGGRFYWGDSGDLFLIKEEAGEEE